MELHYGCRRVGAWVAGGRRHAVCRPQPLPLCCAALHSRGALMLALCTRYKPLRTLHALLSLAGCVHRDQASNAFSRCDKCHTRSACSSGGPQRWGPCSSLGRWPRYRHQATHQSGCWLHMSIGHYQAPPASSVTLYSAPQVVRYPWYAASLAGGAPGWLTWARYSAFLPLYPVGVASEMWLLAGGLPAARGRRLHSVTLPNTWNFSFDYAWFLVVSTVCAARLRMCAQRLPISTLVSALLDVCRQGA